MIDKFKKKYGNETFTVKLGPWIRRNGRWFQDYKTIKIKKGN